MEVIVHCKLSIEIKRIHLKLDWILACSSINSSGFLFVCIGFMQRDALVQIVQEIKDMNTVFERTEGSGVNWEHEFGFFQEEIGELYEEGISDKSLIGSLDALVDICVFAVGGLHKNGSSTDMIVSAVQESGVVDIWSVSSADMYREHCVAILKTVLVALQTFVREYTVVELFHEVYLSNMSKLKDGKPVPGNLPGKFGKNMETYFKPDLEKYLH